VVGYAYQQITGDSGWGATFGDFKSRVLDIGPQVGFLFPVGDMQGYLNLKGYKEFAAEHRAEGWNVLADARDLTRRACARAGKADAGSEVGVSESTPMSAWGQTRQNSH